MHGSHGPAAPLAGGGRGDAPHGGIRRGTAPDAFSHRAAGHRDHVRNYRRRISRRPGPLCHSRCFGGGMARPRRRTLAPLRRPGPALRRLAHRPAARRTPPLPGHGAAFPERGGELPPPDAAAGLCRNAVGLGTDDPRTPATAIRRIAPHRRRTPRPAADGARSRSRRRSHGGRRTAGHHPGTPRPLLPQRAFAPAGRVGTPHGSSCSSTPCCGGCRCCAGDTC